MAYDDDDSGALTSAFANPWISVPYALASGLAAGAYPGTARMAHGVNQGLQFGLGAEKYAAEEAKKKRLSEALDRLSNTTTPVKSTKIGVDPQTSSFSLVNEGQRLSEALGGSPLAPPKPLPTFETTEQKPVFNAGQREYLKAIGKEDPKAGINAIGSTLFKEPAAPHVFGSAESGFYGMDRSGNVTPLVQGTPKQTSPWRPYTTDLGDKIETGSHNQITGERRIEQILPKGAAPAAPKTPDELARIRSATDLNRAKIAQVQSSIQIAQNAKRATVGQLAQALNSLNTAGNLVNDESEAQLINDAKRAVLQELAVRKSMAPGQGGGEPQPAPAAETAGTTFETLPPASQYKGRTLNGGELRSDGKNWIDRNGKIVGASSAPKAQY